MKLHLRDDMNISKYRLNERVTPGFAPNKIKELKAIIRQVASLDPDVTTYEELHNIAKQFGYNSVVRQYEQKGLSIEDCIDKLIDELRYWVKYGNEQQQKKAEYDNTIDNRLIPKITKYLNNNYTIIDTDHDDEHMFWCVRPPVEGESVIDFVDGIVATVNGDYTFTGRGGSWSVWNLVTSDGIQLKAGWDTRYDKFGDNWMVEIPYYSY